MCTYEWWHWVKILCVCYLLELKITIVFLLGIMDAGIYISSYTFLVVFINFGGVTNLLSEIRPKVQWVDHSVLVALWPEKLGEAWPYSHTKLLGTVILVLWATLLAHDIWSAVRLQIISLFFIVTEPFIQIITSSFWCCF